MNVEAELPDNFDELSNEMKIQKLEGLKKDLSSEQGDSKALKERLIEEMIRSYSEEL